MFAIDTSPAPNDQHEKVVRIYIDNSNLWLQGRKTYAEKRRRGITDDITWRFDVGRLKTILLQHIELKDYTVQIYLFGSEPPPVDTVWKALSARDVQVTTYKRNQRTKKEKEVDNGLTLAAALQLGDDRINGVQSEFVIVSGDRDLRDTVLKIAQRGVRVHVWSWENGLAGVYKHMNEDRVQVHLLDDYLDDIGYCATSWRVDRERISPYSVVVMEWEPEPAEISELVSTLPRPAYHYQYVTQRPDASCRDLVIIPLFAESMSIDERVGFFHAVRKTLASRGLTLLTFADYTRRYFKDAAHDDLALATTSQELLQRDPTPTEEAHPNSSEHRTPPQVEQTIPHSPIQRCKWGVYCQKELNCTYPHTAEDKQFFKILGHKSAKKYALCTNENCTRGQQCWFAHGEKELLCPTCDRVGAGHDMNHCPLNYSG